MATPNVKYKDRKYVKYRCRLCNHSITLGQKHFEMGICSVCSEDIPDHIPWIQTHKYLVNKILKRGKNEKQSCGSQKP